MKFKKYLTEAINIDTVKKALVGQPIWDYKNMFNEIFDNKYRKIIGRIEPDESFLEEHKLFLDLEELFTYRRYLLTKESYIKGFVTQDKQQYKIGKLLNKWYQEDDDEDLLNYLESFRDDPLRKKSRKPYLVVVSKHPYDVLGASTDRHWVSCINLGGAIIYTKEKDDREKSKQMNAENLVNSLNNPYMVAYLVDPDDSNSQGKIMIQRPLARILIYPFKHEDGERFNWSVGDLHGNPNSDFSEIVKEWVIDLNSKFKEEDDELFGRISGAYYDSYDEEIVKSWPDPEDMFSKTNRELKNVDLNQMILEFEGVYQYYSIYDTVLRNFIDKDIMKNPLVDDVDFYNDHFERIVRDLLMQTPISLVYPSIDDFDIHRVYESGNVHLDPIKMKEVPESLKDDTYDEGELMEEHGPHFLVALILEKISQFDRDFKYYKSLANTNLVNFFEELPKMVGEKLLEIDVDPDISNWQKLDYNDMSEIVDELSEDFRMG